MNSQTMSNKTPYFIGICGGSASGKTSIAKTISSNVNGQVPIISLDWYYLPIEKEAGPTHNWDHPDSFDWKLINQHLDTWIRGEGVMTPRHDYAEYKQIYNVELVKAAPVMIFEGILAFADKNVRSKLDLLIYVKCDNDTALKRRLIRDVEERKYNYEDVVERYFTHVKPAFHDFIEPAEKLAHITLVNNSHDSISGGIINHKGVDHIVDAVKYKLYNHKK
jgi:uridine kinase